MKLIDCGVVGSTAARAARVSHARRGESGKGENMEKISMEIASIWIALLVMLFLTGVWAIEKYNEWKN
ncbi:MAG: hypothetical protein DRJ03_02855 [Chloroflexi bacterium]|nr:MAG: hypothetical protein DRJ03_02855 [Chloroflexota bacterium]